MLRDAFGLVMGMAQDADGLPILQLYAPGAKVTAVRAGAHPDRERLVLDLDGESPFDWQCTGDQVELYLAPPADSPLPKRQVSLEGFSLQEIVDVSRTVSPDGFGLVEVNLREDCVPEVFTLTDPARIVIDIPLAAPLSAEPPPVAPPPPTPPKAGQPVWKLMHFPMQLGMMDAYVLRLSQTDPRWMIRPALATETLPHRRTVLTMVRRLGGVAGINAGYFAWEGPPVGTVVIDGEWICTPVKPYQRTCLAIDKSGKISMGRWAFRGKVNFENHGYLRLTAINRSHYDGNELVMYTRRYGTTLEGCNLYTRIVVGEGGAITLKESQGRPVEIPERGYVISGRARYSDLLGKVEVGEKVRLELGTEPALPNLWCLIEGGPRNVADGKTCNYADVERFQDDVRYGHCSRSAIGLTKNGDMLLVAVESPGRERGGLYLDEMAAIMKKLGAVQAMNWDGGGSTTVVQGRPHHQPRRRRPPARLDRAGDCPAVGLPSAWGGLPARFPYNVKTVTLMRLLSLLATRDSRLATLARIALLPIAVSLLFGCAQWRAARHNRGHGVYSLEQALPDAKWLSDVTTDWKVTVDYTAAKLPPDAALAGFPIGNGECFAATGLHYPLGTLENVYGPTYQKVGGSFGQIMPVVYLGQAPAQWEKQEMTWVRPGGIVRTASTAGGLTVTTYDFAAPKHRAILRVTQVSNTGQQGLGPVSLAHLFSSPNPEMAANEARLTAGEFGLRCGYLDSRAFPLDEIALPYDPAKGSGSTNLKLPENSRGLRCPLGSLGAGQSVTKLFYLVFIDAKDDGSATLQALQAGPSLLNQAQNYWQTRDGLQVTASDQRLADLLRIEQYLMQVQQASEGGFSPMHGYTKCWIRDSNGPVRYLLACGDYEAVKRYLVYQFKGYAEQGRVSNNLMLNLVLPEAAKRVDWSQARVPAAEIASFMILQRYWYWRHTGDNDLIREQWPLLRRCLLGQKLDERGTLPFFGDETYRFPGYELFNQGQPAPEYVNMRLRSLDSAMEYVVAAQALAEMAPVVGSGGEAGEYRAAADRVRAATEQYFWQADRSFYAPAVSDLSAEPQQNPFAPINLHAWWLAYPGDAARQASNLDAVLRYLSKPSGTLLTTPEFGYYTPMTPGYLLYALSKAGHPARDQALKGLLAAAENSGGFAEMNTPDDRPSDQYWGQHRFRPWEGGINAEAVLYALTGFEADVPTRHIRFSPWLPAGMTIYDTTITVGGERLTLEFGAHRCLIQWPPTPAVGGAVWENSDAYEVDLRFLTAGPTPQVTGEWAKRGGRMEVGSDAYGQKVILLRGMRIPPGGSLEMIFYPPLQPARGTLPQRQPFTWNSPRSEWLKPVVLLTWDAQTLLEQRAKHGGELGVLDTKLSWPTAYLRQWLFAGETRRARQVILDVSGWPGAFKRPEYWAEAGEGGQLLQQFRQAGGQVEQLQTGRQYTDEVPDI